MENQKINNYISEPSNRQSTKSQTTLQTVKTYKNTKEKNKKKCCNCDCKNCTWDYIKKNYINSKSNEYSPIGFLLSTILCAFINIISIIFPIIYSSIDFDPKKPYFYELMSNWNSYPISEISIGNSDSFWYTLNVWQGTNISRKYYYHNDTFFDYNYTKLTFNEENGKKCGKDSIGNDLYFPKDTDCPINEIFIDDKENVEKNNQFIYTTLPLKNNKYLHYTKDNTEGKIIVQIIIRGEKNYCTNQIIDDKLDDECFYLDNCYTDKKYFNEEECYQSDLYTPIDTMNFKDFRIDNNLEESKYYKDNDEVSLNVRTWIGLDKEYKSKLNFTDDYYEKMDLKFKWQIVLSVFSIINMVFFLVNYRLLFIKCNFLCLEISNILISLFIFILKLKKNTVEMKKIRAYYFLYCFIYENLNKNYPKLKENKKYLLKYFYLLLQSGYIIEFISLFLRFIYVIIIAIYDYNYRCGCKCDECLVKDCLNCSYLNCITYKKFKGKYCSCNCEECIKRRCFLCKGNIEFCCDCCCCYYCELNIEIKKVDRCVGLCFDMIIIFLFIDYFLAFFSALGEDEVSIISSDFEKAAFND